MRDKKQELKWVDAEKARSEKFDYSAADLVKDGARSQLHEATRGVQRLGHDAAEIVRDPKKVIGQAIGQMQTDARTKTSEPPGKLISESSCDREQTR